MSRAGARIKFSAQPGDRLLLLTPLVGTAGKQRLPHSGQHLVVKAQPAQQLVNWPSSTSSRTYLRRQDAGKSYRTVETIDPPRDRTASSYEPAVRAWHEQRASIYERLIREQLGEDECGAFLVWGDPSLYDSTLRIIDQIIVRGTIAFEYEVIPGISAIQALAAKHRIALNRIGRSIHITTGRKIAEGLPNNVDDVVVMLDTDCSFKAFGDSEIDIYWGAYVGTEDELLVSGNLRELMHDIERMRAEAKARKGWIMDTYLLRKRDT